MSRFKSNFSHKSWFNAEMELPKTTEPMHAWICGTHGMEEKASYYFGIVYHSGDDWRWDDNGDPVDDDVMLYRPAASSSSKWRGPGEPLPERKKDVEVALVGNNRDHPYTTVGALYSGEGAEEWRYAGNTAHCGELIDRTIIGWRPLPDLSEVRHELPDGGD